MSLRDKTYKAVESYLGSFDDHELLSLNLYEFILQEVERGMIEAALKRCSSNQAWTASLLGLSRNTLRKKMTFLEIKKDFNKTKRRSKKKELKFEIDFGDLEKIY